MKYFTSLSPLLIAFVETALLGFLIGLEWHSFRRATSKDLGFGTTSTLTLLAVFGLGLAIVDPTLKVYGIGLLALGALLVLEYQQRLRTGDNLLLTTLIALLVYSFGPLALHGPLWLPILFVIVILLVLGEKPGIRRLSDAFRNEEAITLVKFFIMAGVILPLLPDQEIAPFISVTWSQVWLAVIVVSAISYLSYLAQTYFFPSRGVLLTGVLGGLYSSTAATVVLGKRAHGISAAETRMIGAAIVLATLMMYLRLWVMIVALGHLETAIRLALPFSVAVVASALIAWLMLRAELISSAPQSEAPPRHPLEFSTALLFAFLFVLFAGLTHFAVQHFGANGLHILSFMVGFTDIDPFILSLLDGKFHVSEAALEAAILIASGSNNLLKAGYAVTLSRNPALYAAAGWLALTFLLSIGYVWVRLAG
jgi:uncharacterized membrane protein (DUF4010 family)